MPPNSLLNSMEVLHNMLKRSDATSKFWYALFQMISEPSCCAMLQDKKQLIIFLTTNNLRLPANQSLESSENLLIII